MAKVAGSKRKLEKRAPDHKSSVVLSDPQWRALCAVLYSALSITIDAVNRTLIKGLYDDIQRQVDMDIHPIVVDKEEGTDVRDV